MGRQLLDISRSRAVCTMAVAAAFHFAGFELTRSATIALFSSQHTGFSSISAAPFSSICVTPASILLVWVYSICFRRFGSRNALKLSCWVFSLVVFGSGIGLFMLEGSTETHILSKRLCQFLVFQLNVMQGAFVQLISSQQWSFISAICGQEGVIYFAPICGFASIASTIAAMVVAPLIDNFGLCGLLVISSFCLVSSSLIADDAYRIAQNHNLTPNKLDSRQKPSSSECLFQATLKVFDRVPILTYLALEVIICQCVSSIVTFLFMLKVKDSIDNDEERAKWTGSTYALINACSGILQFAVLPLFLKHYKPKWLWLLMPCSMAACTTFLSSNEPLSLDIVGLMFSLFKALEYSIRTVVIESVFTSLDYDNRLIVKQVIEVVANRFGSSIMAMLIAFVSIFFNHSVYLEKLIIQALSLSSLLWILASYPMTHIKHKSD